MVKKEAVIASLLSFGLALTPVASALDARREGSLERLQQDAATQRQVLISVIQRVLDSGRHSHADEDQARVLYLRDFNAGYSKVAGELSERREASLAGKTDLELGEELNTIRRRAEEAGNQRVLLALESLERDTTRTLRDTLLSVNLEEQGKRMAEKAAAALAQLRREGKSINQMLQEVKLELESGKVLGDLGGMGPFILFPCTMWVSLYVPDQIVEATGSKILGAILGLPFLVLLPATVLVDAVVWWPILFIFFL